MKIHKIDGKEYYSFNCNEYIRTDEGIIFQNDEPWNLYPVQNLRVKKSAERLIDIIEEGDIVNGLPVAGIDDYRIWCDNEYMGEGRYINIYDIKTVLTYEQYAKNLYKVNSN